MIALAGIVDLVESEQHHGRVVHVRIKLIVEFEVPSARRNVLHLHRPIALVTDFFGEHPVSRLKQALIVFQDSSLAQSKHRVCGVPHRGHAGLHAEGSFLVRRGGLFDAELLKLLDGANDLRIVERVAKAPQRDNRVQHRRVNRAEAVGALEPFKHPLLSLLQSNRAQRAHVHALEPVRHAVE